MLVVIVIAAEGRDVVRGNGTKGSGREATVPMFIDELAPADCDGPYIINGIHIMSTALEKIGHTLADEVVASRFGNMP